MVAETGTGTATRRGTGIGFVFLRDANLMHAVDLFRSFKGLRFILHNQYP